MLDFERNKDREHKIYFFFLGNRSYCIIIPWDFFFKKRTSLYGGCRSKERMLDFLYSISKQGTKDFYFYFFGGGAGGGGGGGGGEGG